MTQPTKVTSFENLEALFKAYPDLKEEVQQSVSHGDFVSIEPSSVQPKPLSKASFSKPSPPEVNTPSPVVHKSPKSKP